MKIFKQAVVPILAVIGGVTIIYQVFNFTHLSITPLLRPIAADSAAEMINAYQNNNHRIMHLSEDCSKNKEVISFKIEASVLNRMINRRPFTIKKYDDILIFPAMARKKKKQGDNEDYHYTDPDSRNFTLVFAGIKNNHIDPDSFHDYCRPCPNNCPDDVNYSSLEADFKKILTKFSFVRSDCD